MELRTFLGAILVGAVCTLVSSQQRNVPNTISSCYLNSTAYNRFTRQPMHIDNLISIIRKIEEKTNHEWTMRRISRSILKQFQFDGLKFDPYRKPEFQFETDELEDHRTSIVFQSIAGTETLPEGILDNDEKCALHWMLSHSINNTRRDEETASRQFLRAKRGVLSHDQDSDYLDYQVMSVHVEDENGAVVNEDVDIINVEPESGEVSGSGLSSKVSPKFRKTTQTRQTTATTEHPDLKVLPGIPSDRDDDYQNDSEHYIPGLNKFERQTEIPTTKYPLETGVVYTRWGSISAGQLIAGIACGLEPVLTPITVSAGPTFGGATGGSANGNSNFGGFAGGSQSRGASGFNSGFGSGSSGRGWGNEPTPQKSTGIRWKRQTANLQPLSNVYAATLAGDIGQAAILNGVYTKAESQSVPTGQFNDTICPREYIMDPLADPNADVSHKHDTWSYMTAPEIRGGIDGLVLGLQIQKWEYQNRGLRLSQVLEMYYSEVGVVDEPRYRACNRQSVFTNTINTQELLEQAKSFAYVYNNRSSTIKVPATESQDLLNQLSDLVTQAFSKMNGFVGNLPGLDGTCKLREQGGATEIPDSDKPTPAQATVYAVLDATDTDYDLLNQKRFVAQLGFELGVSPFGSRLGLVNGGSGQLMIKPNFTDNPSILACTILSQRTPGNGQNGIIAALTTLEGEIQRVKELEITNNYTDTNGIAILILNEGKQFEESLQSEVRSKIKDFENKFGDVHVVYATSKYQVSAYEKFSLNQEYDVIRIQSATNLSTEAGRFAGEFLKRQPGRITYPRCNKDRYDQSNEHKIGTDLFISPNTIRYYKISPDYFYSAENLRLRFSSDNGKVKICTSKSNRFPNSQNTGSGSGVSCYETSGQYQPAGSTTADLEISFDTPCGGDGDRKGCKAIYLSITPISFPVAGSVGFDCSVDNCQYSNQVKVTFSHYDMRCNGAMNLILSFPGLFVTLALSIFTLTRNL